MEQPTDVGQAPDGIEPMVLWRFWRVKKHRDGTVHLTSAVRRDVWEPKTRMDAVCAWRTWRSILREHLPNFGFLLCTFAFLGVFWFLLGLVLRGILRFLWESFDANAEFADNLPLIFVGIISILFVLAVTVVVISLFDQRNKGLLPHNKNGEPQPDCECGIYGVHTVTELKGVFKRTKEEQWNEDNARGYAFGRILAWGGYIPGEKGARVQHAKIYDLFVTDGDVAQELRDTYSVDVTVGLPNEEAA